VSPAPRRISAGQFWDSAILPPIPVISRRHLGVHSHAIASVAASFAENTRRHIAVRLLPFVFLLYITNYLDRTSVAYAAIGMSRDLGFDDRVFGLGIGFIAKALRSRTVLLLSSAAFLQYFLLGAAEAGFMAARM